MRSLSAASTYRMPSPPLRVEQVRARWAAGGRAEDSSRVHAVYPAADLWPYREFTRTRSTGRLSPARWDALEERIRRHGMAGIPPLQVSVGKDGILVTDGNHRLAIARELGIPVPVQFVFVDTVEAARNPAEPPEYRRDNPDTSYRGAHRAPDRDGNAPMWDLTANDVYPENVYSVHGPRYYGVFDGSDSDVWTVVRSARGKPDRKITVYRAIPKVLSKQDRVNKLREDMAYILRTGKIPKGGRMRALTPSAEYNALHRELSAAEHLPDTPTSRGEIHPGDWVTPSRAYAVGHGRSALRGEYRIVQKTVAAADLYTDGNSIMEWGYSPETPRVENPRRPGPRSAAQTPALPHERVRGSRTNAPGTATATGAEEIRVSATTQTALQRMIDAYVEKYPEAPRPTLPQLLAVYRRGAGAYSVSHRPDKTRAQWAFARVQTFLRMLRGAKVKEAYRRADADLLSTPSRRQGNPSTAAERHGATNTRRDR